MQNKISKFYGQFLDQVELESGTEFDELVVSGGMVRSGLLLRLIADATQKRVFVPHCVEPVLLGKDGEDTVSMGMDMVQIVSLGDTVVKQP